ncbi:hypothetical protein HDV02_003616 [Globomyces sp. JEL0801]|nr:hypothetical protein HDV02_003616 [Globomyces sp. JEL0801]
MHRILTLLYFSSVIAGIRVTPFGTVPLNVNEIQKQQGIFEIVATSVLATIHAVLAPKTGKILQLERTDGGEARNSHACEFDYYAAYSRVMSYKSDVFCSSGFVATDNEATIYNVGGWNGPSAEAIRKVTPCGSPGIFGICDWKEDATVATLKVKRWYPTALPLPSGRVVVIGGTDGPTGLLPPAVNEPTVEFLPPLPKEVPITLQLLIDTDTYNLYPIVHVLSNGYVFLMAGARTQLHDPTFQKPYIELPVIPDGKRTYPFTGSSALLTLSSKTNWQSEILVCGGTTDTNVNAIALASCGRIVATSPKPVLIYRSSNHVLSGWAGFANAKYPIYDALLYDPKKVAGKRFTPLAKSTIARLYHSIAMMVEDGSVIVMGSTPNANANALNPEYPNEHRIEVFYPPYLLTGATRPQAVGIPEGQWDNGQQYSFIVHIPTDDMATATISIFTNDFVTHSNHAGQRRVELDVTNFEKIEATWYKVTVQIPPPAIAIPGWYMLFVTDNGMPSIAKWIKVGGDLAIFSKYFPI